MTPDRDDDLAGADQFDDNQHFDPSSEVIAEKVKLWTNPRRQYVVRRVLAAPARELSLRDLAQDLRDQIDDHSSQDPDYDDIRQALRRRHLPRLAEHDVVDFDNNVIRPGPEFGEAVSLLVRSDPHV